MSLAKETHQRRELAEMTGPSPVPVCCSISFWLYRCLQRTLWLSSFYGIQHSQEQPRAHNGINQPNDARITQTRYFPLLAANLYKCRWLQVLHNSLSSVITLHQGLVDITLDFIDVFMIVVVSTEGPWLYPPVVSRVPSIHGIGSFVYRALQWTVPVLF